MKNYMKMTGVVAVLLSMAASVNAEKDALKIPKNSFKEAISSSQEERERRYAMPGHLLSTAQHYLTDEENEQIKKLMGEGWKGKNSGRSQKMTTKG